MLGSEKLFYDIKRRVGCAVVRHRLNLHLKLNPPLAKSPLMPQMKISVNDGRLRHLGIDSLPQSLNFAVGLY